MELYNNARAIDFAFTVNLIFFSEEWETNCQAIVFLKSNIYYGFFIQKNIKKNNP